MMNDGGNINDAFSNSVRVRDLQMDNEEVISTYSTFGMYCTCTCLLYIFFTNTRLTLTYLYSSVDLHLLMEPNPSPFIPSIRARREGNPIPLVQDSISFLLQIALHNSVVDSIKSSPTSKLGRMVCK